jgi:intein/homing endonuclease
LYIAGHPTEDKEYYDKYLGPLFSKTLVGIKPKLYPYWKVYGIHTYKRDVIKKIIGFGVKKGVKGTNLKLPTWIFSNKELMKAALRGIFDTDGSFHCKKCYGKYDNAFRREFHCQPRITITSISKNLIEDVFKICRELGLNPERIKIRKQISVTRNNKQDYLLKLKRLEEIQNISQSTLFGKNLVFTRQI